MRVCKTGIGRYTVNGAEIYRIDTLSIARQSFNSLSLLQGSEGTK